MKSRFNTPFVVKYDYDNKLKEKAENFKNEIMHHYVQDSQIPNSNESTIQWILINYLFY